jgi:CubicO group peptidase (beta-lactamase class C family)
MRGGYSRQALLKDMEELPRPEAANASFAYSNFGYGILALILEEVSGKNYEELLRTKVTEKYGLRSTSSLVPSQQVATPYFIGARQKATQSWEMGYEKAAGGLFSNLEELSSLLKKQLRVYQQKDTTHSLYLSGDQRPMSPDGHWQYGLGMMQIRSAFDTTIQTFQHSGDLDGFASQYKMLPDRQVGYIILTSSGGTWINELDALIERILLDIQPREVATLPKKALKRFCGTYRFPSEQELRLERKGDELYSLFPGTDPIQVYPESAKRLFFRSMNVQIDFPEENEDVDSITYWQNGRAFQAKKVR